LKEIYEDEEFDNFKENDHYGFIAADDSREYVLGATNYLE